MIGAFEVRLDLRQGKPRGLELHTRIERRLIEVVRRARVCALPEGDDGARAHAARRELGDAHISVAAHAVAPTCAARGRRVEGEDVAERARAAHDGQARLRVAERLLPARVCALQTVDLAPRDAPSAPVAYQLVARLSERAP